MRYVEKEASNVTYSASILVGVGMVRVGGRTWAGSDAIRQSLLLLGPALGLAVVSVRLSLIGRETHQNLLGVVSYARSVRARARTSWIKTGAAREVRILRR